MNVRFLFILINNLFNSIVVVADSIAEFLNAEEMSEKNYPEAHIISNLNQKSKQPMSKLILIILILNNILSFFKLLI
jgi:hypothetical protein